MLTYSQITESARYLLCSGRSLDTKENEDIYFSRRTQLPEPTGRSVRVRSLFRENLDDLAST